jgi:hypothetical protein
VRPGSRSSRMVPSCKRRSVLIRRDGHGQAADAPVWQARAAQGVAPGSCPSRQARRPVTGAAASITQAPGAGLNRAGAAKGLGVTVPRQRRRATRSSPGEIPRAVAGRTPGEAKPRNGSATQARVYRAAPPGPLGQPARLRPILRRQRVPPGQSTIGGSQGFPQGRVTSLPLERFIGSAPAALHRVQNIPFAASPSPGMRCFGCRPAATPPASRPAASPPAWEPWGQVVPGF